MAATNRLADALFTSYPTVVKRGSARLPLQRGDLVADVGLAHLPRIPDDSIGRIARLEGNRATVEWRDGSSDQVSISAITRVADRYEPAFHDSAFELPKFTPGTKVVLGNGDRGRVLEQLTGPTGFKSFRIQIDKSIDSSSIGRRVFATQNAMLKVGRLLPDSIVSIFKEGTTEAVGIVGCELAVSQTAQMVGLQKYSSLPSENGMLFPYDPPRDVAFHMGDVSFPIDVVFVDGNGKIAAIEPDCQPGQDQYWKHRRIAAVLEVNGGWCDERGIHVGDRVRIGTAKSADQMMHTLTGPKIESDDRGDDRFLSQQTNDDILGGEEKPILGDSVGTQNPGVVQDSIDDPAFGSGGGGG